MYNFFSDYKFLGVMKKMFPSTPILGLTATATARVIEDVQKILDIQGCLILKASFNRPNLFYEVSSLFYLNSYHWFYHMVLENELYFYRYVLI